MMPLSPSAGIGGRVNGTSGCQSGLRSAAAAASSGCRSRRDSIRPIRSSLPAKRCSYDFLRAPNAAIGPLSVVAMVGS